MLTEHISEMTNINLRWVTSFDYLRWLTSNLSWPTVCILLVSVFLRWQKWLRVREMLEPTSPTGDASYAISLNYFNLMYYFRESRLTRLLQDSLGGNARTFLVATLSPSMYEFHFLWYSIVQMAYFNVISYLMSIDRIVRKAFRHWSLQIERSKYVYSLIFGNLRSDVDISDRQVMTQITVNEIRPVDHEMVVKLQK